MTTIQGDIFLTGVYIFTIATCFASCFRYVYKKYCSSEVAPEFTNF